MDQFTELDLGDEQGFGRLAEELSRAHCADAAQWSDLRARFVDLVQRVRDAASSNWIESAEVVSGLFELALPQSASDGAAAGTLPLEALALLHPMVSLLGRSLSGEMMADDALWELREQARARWGDALDVVGELPIMPEEVLLESESVDDDPAWGAVDPYQIAAILQTLETPMPADTPAVVDAVDLSEEPAATGAVSAPFDMRDALSNETLPAPPTPPAPEYAAIDDGLLEALLDDAHQCLSRMERIVLDDQPNSPQAAKESSRLLRRELHTLKGASASVDLKSLAAYLHEMETWLERMDRSGSTTGVRDQVLACVDAVRQYVDVLRTPPANSTPAASHPNGVRPAISPSSAPLTRLDDASDAGEGTLRVKTAQLDRLMDLLAQLAMLRSRRDSRGTELQRILDQLNRVSTRLESALEEVALPQPALAAPGGEYSGLQSKLAEILADLGESLHGLRQIHEPLVEENRALSHFVGEFRQEIVQMRRLPLSGLFRRLQRAAFDAARSEGKQVQFELRGDHAGLERSLQERLFEPLLHMVRNAVSHGIEPSAERVKAGKPAVGTVALEAYGSPHMLVLEVADDGRGLDYDAIRRRGLQRGLIPPDRPISQQELARLIFHPGFTTKDVSTGVSGRGVGMDIVAATLERLHCLLEVDSQPGGGTRFRMSLPLYSIIEHVMVFRTAGRLFGLPMTFVKLAGDVGGDPSSRGDLAPVPAVPAAKLLQLPGDPSSAGGRKLVIGLQRSLARRHSAHLDESHPEAELRDLVLHVDEIVGPEEIVVRSLPPLLKDHPYLSGVTVSGQGEVLQLLDCHRLIKHYQTLSVSETSSHSRPPAGEPQAAPARRVLVADDSVSARRRLIQKLEQFGFEIHEASDGMEALEKLRAGTFDVLFTDLEMDCMDGFELLSELQQNGQGNPRHAVMITSRYDPAVRERCRQLGGSACLPKPISDRVLNDVLSRMQLTDI